MNASTQRYLDRRADLERWALQGSAFSEAKLAVVIPALGEYPGIFDTLADLEANPAAEREETLVVVVVNNRDPEHAASGDIVANQETLARLSSVDAFHLCWVDASSPGIELPAKEGVGLARKIGMDHALTRLQSAGAIVCLDADTRVDEEYLPALATHFAEGGAHAAVIDYAHPADADEAEAITDYERYLRIHELGLAWAGSPYAYTAIGSAMTCSAQAYVQAGGMNRRQAGEDFYFLQQLAKAGRIDRIGGTCVRPSPRSSHRVPFGTGRRVGQVLAGTDTILAYHPESYRILSNWLGAMESAEDIAVLHPVLAGFLHEQGYENARAKILENAKQPDQCRAQLHRWFDAFRTLKLFHYLREHGFPDQSLGLGIPAVLRMRGEANEAASLDALRSLCKTHWRPRGICT